MKKEKLEDIDVMEGIDFKSNQERIRRQVRRKQSKKTILLGIIGITIIVVSCILLNFTTKQFVNNCTSAGYSENYCERKA